MRPTGEAIEDLRHRLPHGLAAGDQRKRIEIALQRQVERRVPQTKRIDRPIDADRVRPRRCGELRGRRARRPSRRRSPSHPLSLGARPGRCAGSETATKPRETASVSPRRSSRRSAPPRRRSGIAAPDRRSTPSPTARSARRRRPDSDRRRAAPGRDPASRARRSCSSRLSRERRRSRASRSSREALPSPARSLRIPGFSRSMSISLDNRASPSGFSIASSLGPSPSTTSTRQPSASGTTNMSENRIAASKPKRRMGCKVASRGHFRRIGEIHETSGLRPQRPIFRQKAASLPHEPDGRRIDPHTVKNPEHGLWRKPVFRRRVWGRHGEVMRQAPSRIKS